MTKELSRLRPLLVAQIIVGNTDEDHLICISQILQRLHDEYGIDSYRATIAKDIELLGNAGLDIQLVKKSQNWYHYLGREFDVAELKILVDAIESAKFITKKRSSQLVEKITKLAGPFMAESLVRNIDVERRIKADNEGILYVVDAINEAINRKKQIRFQYFEFNIKKEKKKRFDGYWYIFSPYRLVWNGDYYYVVGYYEKYNDIVSFRVDRIVAIPEIIETDAIQMPSGFDLDEHLNTMFRMFSSERKKVVLICDNSTIDAIIDRFGENIDIFAYDMNSFRIEVDIACNKVFYSWVFGFNGKVKIKAPNDVKSIYKQMVVNATECCE